MWRAGRAFCVFVQNKVDKTCSKLYFLYMYLFMFLLLPLILAAWCFYKKDSHLIPAIFLGIIVAVLVCGFKVFFLYSHRIIPYSFKSNVLFLLVRQTLLPVVLLYGIFFAWSKDEISYKIEAFFPLLLSFYMLYLPYTIISTAEGLYTTFPLFVKPVLFVVMIFSLGLGAKHIEKTVKNKKYVFTAVWIIICLVSVLVPSLLESMYILDMNYLFVLLLSAVYSAVLPVLFILSKLGVLTVKD